MKEWRTTKLLVSCCNDCPCFASIISKPYCQLTNTVFHEGHNGNDFHKTCPMKKTKVK